MVFISFFYLGIRPSQCLFYSFELIRFLFFVSKCLSLTFINHIELYYFTLSGSTWPLQTGHLADDFFLGTSRARSGSVVRLCVLPFFVCDWLFIQKMMGDNCLSKRYGFVGVLGVNESLFDCLRNLSPKLLLAFEIFGH